MSDSRFLIGEIARLTGTAPSAMRFYESRGLLNPDKDRGNRYRHYAPEESANLLLAKHFRSLGISIDNLTGLAEAGGYPDVAATLGSRLDAIDEELTRLFLMRKETRERKERLECVAGRIGSIWMSSEEPFYRLNKIQNHGIFADDNRDRITLRWMSYLPAIGFACGIPRNFLEAGGEESFGDWGFSLRCDDALRFGDPLESPIEKVEGGPCLSTCIERSTAGEFQPGEIQPLLSEMRRRNLKPVADAFGHLLCSRIQEGKRLYLIELHIPISPSSVSLT